MTDFKLKPKDPNRRINGDIPWSYSIIMKDVFDNNKKIKEKE